MIMYYIMNVNLPMMVIAGTFMNMVSVYSTIEKPNGNENNVLIIRYNNNHSLFPANIANRE